MITYSEHPIEGFLDKGRCILMFNHISCHWFSDKRLSRYVTMFPESYIADLSTSSGQHRKLGTHQVVYEGLTEEECCTVITAYIKHGIYEEPKSVKFNALTPILEELADEYYFDELIVIWDFFTGILSELHQLEQMLDYFFPETKIIMVGR